MEKIKCIDFKYSVFFLIHETSCPFLCLLNFVKVVPFAYFFFPSPCVYASFQANIKCHLPFENSVSLQIRMTPQLLNEIKIKLSFYFIYSTTFCLHYYLPTCLVFYKVWISEEQDLYPEDLLYLVQNKIPKLRWVGRWVGRRIDAWKMCIFWSNVLQIT